MQGITLKFSTHILKVLIEGKLSQMFYLAFSSNFMLKAGNFLVIILNYLHFIFLKKLISGFTSYLLFSFSNTFSWALYH